MSEATSVDDYHMAYDFPTQNIALYFADVSKPGSSLRFVSDRSLDGSLRNS